MTVEEALVALLAAVAGILLFIGLAQALDPRLPRHVQRRLRPGEAADTPRSLPTPTEGSPWASSWDGRSLGEPSAEGSDHPLTAVGGGGPESLSPAALSSAPSPAPTPTDDQDRPERVRLDPLPAEAPLALPIVVDPGMAPIEACAALVLAGKHTEALMVIAPSLDRGNGAGSTSSAHVMTGCWSLAALSRKARGEDAEAEAALAAALQELPDPVTDGCPPRLAALSIPIARRLLEAGEQSAEEANERIIAPRLAAFWLHWRLIAAPGDPDAEGLLEAARGALAGGYADAATGLIRRREWVEACRLIDQTRAANGLSATRAELLVELLAAALRREVERLTAPVIRGTKNESRAVGALERAEALLASMRGASLPARQSVAMSRRIWRGYAKLGTRRLGAGNLDGAAAALFHALGMTAIGRRRQRHVRDALVRTIEAIGDEKAETVAKLLAEDDRPAAAEQVERLISRIHQAREGGVTQEQLTVVSTKARQLAQQVESELAR